MLLIIGNKNYSSWSLRPWLALRVAGIAFEEHQIALYAPDSKARILAFSPAGKVPCLVDGAMYAPVVLRFRTYAFELPPPCRAYADALLALAAMREWIAAAEHEPASIAQFEQYAEQRG